MFLLHKIISISLLLIVVGCQSVEKFPKPEQLIPEDKMVEMLVDMALLKAAKSSGREGLEDSGIDPEKFFYNKHLIDSTTFKTNIEYYTNNLKRYEQLFLRAIDTLELRNEKISKIVTERENEQNEKLSKSEEFLEIDDEEALIPVKND